MCMYSGMKTSSFFHFTYQSEPRLISSWIDDNAYHYVLFKNLLNLVNHSEQRRRRIGDVICRNCFHVCTQMNFEKHQASCLKFESAAIGKQKQNYIPEFQYLRQCTGCCTL